jgi:hypothetical protein
MAYKDALGELALRWGPSGAARLAMQPLLTSHAMMFPALGRAETGRASPEIKKRLTAVAAAIIDYLDAEDGDPDFEPEPHEPEADFEPEDGR